jgi:hypothetical protein
MGQLLAAPPRNPPSLPIMGGPMKQNTASKAERLALLDEPEHALPKTLTDPQV